MKPSELQSMSVDELWSLHEEIAAALTSRLASEKSILEDRLRQLTQQRPPVEQKVKVGERERRPYPTVSPKYRNPDDPTETWSGRGKQPRWLVTELKSGKRIDDFRIDSKAERRRPNSPVHGGRNAV